MPQEPVTLNLQIEIVADQGDGRECGVCGLPCFGESSTLYFAAPIRQRLATLCDGCATAWAEWRKTHDFSTHPQRKKLAHLVERGGEVLGATLHVKTNSGHCTIDQWGKVVWQ